MDQEKIVLTLDPKAEKVQAEAIAETIEKTDVVPAKLDLSTLSEEEIKMVNEFAEKIDITDTDVIMSYGANSQKKISNFSTTTLENVKTKDLGQIGGMISDLVVELKDFDAGEE
ncbi:MAG TPA: toxic anion resistance protein, partial [Erysipelotrichaceae bacterium]|nr:toxic anion resistance protein [Erysipelotrichaceae bacterium]